jgi:hypothetical protein
MIDGGLLGGLFGNTLGGPATGQPFNALRGPATGQPLDGPAPRSATHQRQVERRSSTPALDQFGRDLTAEARAGDIDPVIGREAEIAQVVEALSRRRKNNAALIGSAIAVLPTPGRAADDRRHDPGRVPQDRA